jgi:hypothetical protein
MPSFVVHTAISLVEIDVHRGHPQERTVLHTFVCIVMEKIDWRWFPQWDSIYDNAGGLNFIPRLPTLL